MNAQHDDISVPQDYLCTDLGTLRNLLTVNKFFFHATLPHLFNDSLVKWEMNERSSKYSTSRDKLFAVAFVSFMQARLDESQHDSWNDPKVERIVDGVLKNFGLKLNLPFQSSCQGMLETIYRRCRKSNGDNDDDLFRNSKQRMTVDYSKLFNVLSPYEWRYIQLTSMIRLRRLPKTMRDEQTTYGQDDAMINNHLSAPKTDIEASSTTGATMNIGESQEKDKIGYGGDQISDSNDDDDEEHTLEQQHRRSYASLLREALVDMWLYYNYDSVTAVNYEMALARKYLPLSTKMPKLQSLCLNRPTVMLDSYIEDTILFIKQNQAAFPRKPTIDIEFDGSWCFFGDDDIDASYNPMDLSAYNTSRKDRWERAFLYMEPAIAVYQAVGRPRVMRIDGIPNFYGHARNIDLSRLRVLCDRDLERIDRGEKAEMEAFLRRCQSLKELTLGVGNHNVLSWAATDALNSILPLSQRALGSLENLELWTGHSYNFVIHAFNDAMTAFSSSLRSIKLVFRKHLQDARVPTVLRNARTLHLLQLQRQASASTVGDWPFLLPHLRIIEISLNNVACINIGSLDNCPNLEMLEIRFGCTSLTQCRPEGPEPETLPASGQLLDPRWQHAKIDRTLFPIWNLPKLKQLKLYDLAAMRFDFASLTNMPRLESLTIDVNRSVSFGQDLSEYINRQYKLSRSYLSTTSNVTLAQGTEIYRSTLSNKWQVPELKTMSLDGPPSALIYLDLLKSFPKLESLSLRSSGKEHKIVRRALHGVSSLFQQSWSQEQVKSTKRNGALRSGSDDDAPYVESNLKSITLGGGWSMSGQDLTSLLTTYAPFLEELSVDRFNVGESSSGYRFFEAIKLADEINKFYTLTAGVSNNGDSGLPGRKLTKVTCRYIIQESQKLELGLKQIPPNAQNDFMIRGLRTYTLPGHILVDQKDYDL
ncbi:hypothetical protein BGX21_002845 [Mortierella sp. AD011]|nr:hypothetical protein BGX21_002845 [Mortierella sp. AD011]